MSEERYPSGAPIPWWRKPGHYEPPPTGVAADTARIKEEISDLELCLAGKPASKRWQKIKIELDNKKGQLRAMAKGMGWGHGMARSREED